MFLRLTSSTLALTLLTAPSFALTPEEVWTAWTAEYARTGYAVTEGSRDLAGEVLTLKDVTFVQKGEADTMTVRAPQIVLTATGDGKVRTTFGDGFGIELVSRNADDQPVTITGSVKAPGMEVLSSGDAAARTDAVTAPSAVATLDRIDRPEGEDATDVATVTLTDVTGESLSKDGGRSVTSSSRTGKLDYTIDYAGDGDSIKASGSIADLEAGGEVGMPGDGALDFSGQINAALKAGAMLTGTVKLGAGTHAFDFAGTAEDDTPESGKMTVGVGGTELSFRMAQDGLAYQGAMTGLDVQLSASSMPQPVAYRLDEASFDVQAPVLAAATPAPFKFAYSLGGLVLGEEVWAQFDPARKLPRDPASVDIDLTGMVKLTSDLFDPAWREAAADDAPDGQPGGAAGADLTDPEAVEGAEATVPDGTGDAAPGDADGAVSADGSAADAEAAPMPFDVTELTINQFALSGAGVKAEAKGTLTVPEGGDISAPVGTISARYEGVNGLIDTLVAMGVISQEEVMGYRMMLTMFAKPGDGTDVLTTELQFKEGGEIIANGQKIK